jgi:hypothetical protein
MRDPPCRGDASPPGKFGAPGKRRLHVGGQRADNAEEEAGQASCPIDVLDASLKDAYRAKIARLMQDVEPFIKTDIGHYDVGAMVEPGCLAHMVSAS